MVITHIRKNTTKIFFPRLVSQAPLRVLEIGRSNPPAGYDSGRMPRPVWVLHFVLSGKGLICGVPFSAPCAFLFTPDVVQRYTVAADSDTFEQYWIKFSGSAAPAYLAEAGIPDKAGTLPCSYIHKAVALLREALSLSFYQDKDEGYCMLGVLCQLLALHIAAGREASAGTQHISQNVLRICDYIHEHYTESITERALADSVHLSVSYMHKQFTKEMGIPPIRYLNQYRIQCAQRLLLEENLTVAKIAEATGFLDPNYFCCVFQRYSEGLSPTEYRKRTCSTQTRQPARISPEAPCIGAFSAPTPAICGKFSPMRLRTFAFLQRAAVFWIRGQSKCPFRGSGIKKGAILMRQPLLHLRLGLRHPTSESNWLLYRCA